MAHELKSHEFLHLQEHIRSEAAAASTYRSLADQCRDPELERFVNTQADMAEKSVQQMMGYLQG